MTQVAQAGILMRQKKQTQDGNKEWGENTLKYTKEEQADKQQVKLINNQN